MTTIISGYELNKDKLSGLSVLLALLSGCLLTTAFPKIGISYLAWVALVPMLVAIRNLSPKGSFYTGLAAGLAHYLTLVYWLAYTMGTYGHLPYFLCVLILLLLSIYLALYFGVFAMAMVRLCPHPYLCLVIGPLLWVSLEYVRTFLISGFPWELIGYTQYSQLPIIQISDFSGVYGISYVVLFSNMAVFIAFLFVASKRWQGRSVGSGLAATSLVAFALIFCAVWFYGRFRIQFMRDLMSKSGTAKITVVQGNIDQDKKWDPAFQKASTEKYVRLSFLAKKNHPDLFVWPETATPFYFLNHVQLSKLVKKGIDDIRSDFLFGSPSFRQRDDRIEYYNSAFLVGPEGNVYGKYDKSHLVPFGEYVPLKKWLPFVGKMVESVGDFHAGEKGQTLQWEKHHIGVLICYEAIFPDLARRMTNNNAAILFNITNDAWYGRSSAPYQHFSMSILRAVENRRSLVRSANTGISGFVDPVGAVIASTPLFKDAVVTRELPIVDETTLYTRFGDVFAMVCLGLTAMAAFLQLVRRNG